MSIISSKPHGDSALGGAFFGTIFFVSVVSAAALTGGSAGVSFTASVNASGQAAVNSTTVTPLTTNAFQGQGNFRLTGSILGPSSTLVQICNGKIQSAGSAVMNLDLGFYGSGNISLGGNALLSRTTSLLSVGLFNANSEADVSFTLLRDASGQVQSGGASLYSQTTTPPVDVTGLQTSGSTTATVDYYIKPTVSPIALSGSALLSHTEIAGMSGKISLQGSSVPIVISEMPEPYYVLETDGAADVAYIKSLEAPTGNILSMGGADYSASYLIPNATGGLNTQGGATSFPCYNPSQDSVKLTSGGAVIPIITTSTPAGGTISTGGVGVVIGSYDQFTSGGFSLTGSVQPVVIKSLTVQGNISSSGTVIPILTSLIPVGGQISLTGEAGYTNHLITIPAGAISLSGTAPTVSTTVTPAGGQVLTGGVNNTPVINLWLIGQGKAIAQGSADVSVVKSVGTLGNIVSGGSANLSIGVPLIASGNAVTGGTSLYSFDYAPVASGSARLAGSAQVSYSKVSDADGILHLGGWTQVSSTSSLDAFGGFTVLTLHEFSSTFSVDPSGHVGSLQGDIEPGIGYDITTTGSVSLGGENEINILLHEDASGGATLTGSAEVLKTTSMMSLGLLASGGQGVYSVTIQPVISGKVTLGGSALVSFTSEKTTSGGMVTNGSGPNSTAYLVSAGVQTSVSGGASFVNILNIDITGNIQLEGAAILAMTSQPVASGSARLGGSAAKSFGSIFYPSGRLNTSGSALVLKSAAYSAQGLSSVQGSANYTQHIIIDITGSVSFRATEAPVSATVQEPLSQGRLETRGFCDYSYSYYGPASGQVRSGGSALHPTISLGFFGQGAANLNGSAAVVKSTSLIGLGLLSSGGNVNIALTSVQNVSGKLTSGGSVVQSTSYQPIVSGGLSTSGVAEKTFTIIHQPIGGIRVAGIGSLSSTIEFTLLGGAMIINGSADCKFVNIREVFANNFTSSRRVTNSGGNLTKGLDKQLQNKWKWGINAFVHPEDFTGVTIPCFCDAPVPQSNLIQPGTIDNGLKLVDKDGHLLIAPGMFSTGLFNDAVLPSESITQPLAADVLTEMHENPDLKYPVLLRSFKYTDGKLVTNRVYICDSDLASDYSYKFNVSNGIYSIETKTNPAIVIDRTLSPSYTTEDGRNVFVLPEFPAIECNLHDTVDYEIDELKGLIYTSNEVSGIHITYYAVPLLSYVPQGTISEYALIDLQSENDQFITLRNELIV